jgi:RHS repeat-associated protein
MRITYSYDTNPYDSSFSSYTTGRLAAIQYNGCHATTTSGVSGTTFTEMYSYHPAGGVTAKRFQITRTFAPFGSTATNHLDVGYTFDSAGRVSSTSIPVSQGAPSSPATNVNFSTGYDAMGRAASLTDDDPTSANGVSTTWASASYDFAGRLSALQHHWDVVSGSDVMTTIHRGYSVNGELSIVDSLAYNHSGTLDNGQVTTRVDSSTGETIVYQYDALKRLTQASAAGTTYWAPWTQQFQYDGFGNLTAKTLNGVTTSIPVDPATNRLVNSYYDANGNMTSGAGAAMTYDESNRLDSVTPLSGGTEYYTYAPDNKRIGILKADDYTEEWTLYGARGERIGVYSLGVLTSGGVGTVYWPFTRIEKDVWFAGHLIWQYRPGYSVSGLTGSVDEDRNGTDRDGAARFLPYGEEITSTVSDRMKFATYTRDSFTALDYADQRYYASSYGRFNSADPYMAIGAFDEFRHLFPGIALSALPTHNLRLKIKALREERLFTCLK